MSATWEGAEPLRKLGKRWDAKRRQREFDRTITHAEQNAVRRAIRLSTAIRMTASEREGLTALVNLWFRHRKQHEWIEPGSDYLMKKLDVVERTISRLLKWAEGHGFVVAVGGGVGRGHKRQFGLSIQRIMAVLSPNFSASNGSERVTLDGEVLDRRKVDIPRAPIREYQRGKRTASPHRAAADLFHAGCWTSVRFLAGLITRLGQGYTPKPEKQDAHWSQIDRQMREWTARQLEMCDGRG